MPWRTIKNEDDRPLLQWQLETMVRSFFDRELFLDYIGIANELKQTLKTYTDAKGKGSPTHSAEEAYAILAEKLDIIHSMFAPGPRGKGFDYSGFEDEPTKLLVPTANYILGLKDGKKSFPDTVLAMNKAFSLCSTLDCAALSMKLGVCCSESAERRHQVQKPQ